MPPSTTDDSEEQPTPTDLLIRAISTIIWLLWPKAKDARSHSKHHLQRLSRLSLLFVPAIEAADVAAIAAVVDRDGVHVEAVQGSQESLQGRLDVVKNHTKTELWNRNKLPDPESLKAELVKEPLQFCFTSGVAAITPDAHGATLQKLLMDMYERAPTCPETDPSRDSLRRYIYCFCHKKIRQRLQSGILGYNGRFLGLFLKSKQNGRITREDFQRRTQVQLRFPERKSTNEYWLYHALAAEYPGENFGPSPKSGQPYYLHLEEDQLWKLWEFFTSCLEDLDMGLEWLHLNTRGNEADSYAKGLEVLDTIASIMGTLYDFIHTSPTFWNLVVGMSDVLNERMGKELVVEEPRSPWSSPTIGSPDSNRPPSLQEGLSPPLSVSQSSARGVSVRSVELDHHNVTLDVAHESDYESPAHSDGEDSEEDVESKQEGGLVGLSGIALKVRLWLRRVTQWHGAICDLSQGHLALGILNKDISIHVDVAPKAVQPSRQASLRAVAELLQAPGDANERLKWILSRARDLYQNRVLSESTAAHALVNASMDDEPSLERWETLFPSSSVHCEARLACTMYQKQIQNAPIAVSKRCCYCCAILLDKLGFNKADISYHGKVYSWAPPAGLNQDAEKYILKRLKGRLEHYLKEYAPGRREADSSSGSEDGSGTHGDSLRPKRRMAAVISR